ncbi:hypothetical protein IJ556_04260 [bacterium]|nr:hypothetical protein [bacterium]
MKQPIYITINLKRPSCIKIQVWRIFRFSNPFKKRQVGEIVPIFNLIPQVGFALDRNMRSFSIHLGWLNVKFECHGYFCKTINENKIKVK